MSAVRGSDLLLQKLPLSAQARAFAAVDVLSPTAEANSLIGGPEKYPLLAVLSSSVVERSDSRKRPRDEASDIFSPHHGGRIFSGIQRANFFAVPNDYKRRWGKTVAEDDDESPSDNGPQPVGRLVDLAMSLPTQSQLLHPSFQEVDNALKQAQHHLLAQGDANPLDLKVSSTAPQVRDEVAGRHQKYYRNVLASLSSTASQGPLLSAIRQPRGNTPAARDSSSSSSPPAGSTSERMVAIIQDSISRQSTNQTDHPGAGSAEDNAALQQRINNYLRRSSWIQQRQRTNSTGAAADSEPQQWSRLSEAQRVQAALGQTVKERQKFRRPRGEAHP